VAGPLRAERRPPGSWTMTLTHGTPLKSCSGAVKHWTRLQGPGPGPASTARSCLQLSRPSVLCTTAERGSSEELDPVHLHVRSSHKTGTAPGLCLRQSRPPSTGHPRAFVSQGQRHCRDKRPFLRSNPSCIPPSRNQFDVFTRHCA